MPGSQRLDYAPPPRRRRWTARAMYVVAIVALLAMARIWGPGAWLRLRFEYWTQRCLAYPAVPAHVVLESEGQRIIVADHCSVLARWNNCLGLSPIPDADSLIGGIHAPNGDDMLVAVYINAKTKSVNGALCCVAYRVGGLSRGAVEAGESTVLFSPSNRPDGPSRLRVFAGVVDPRDPTHFTVDYELGVQHHVIDGWVKPDRVLLSERP